ncbi:hypothetical protein MCAMS1_00695 [biofilm metagenome]
MSFQQTKLAVPNEPSPNPIRDQAVAWYVRMQSSEMSDSERRQFLRWLNAAPEHKRAYDKVERHWQWLEPLKAEPFAAREAALNYRPTTSSLMVYATAAMLLLGVGLGVYWQQTGMIFPTTYQAAKGQRQSVVLADGSKLELNTDSEVTASINPWQREVEVQRGEVFFQIAHDKTRPFQVRAGRGVITDIGTAFEVYRQPGKVRVAVQEGIVDVAAKTKRRLTAQQQIAYAENGEFITEHEQQSVESLMAWRQGQLVFNARRLDDALAEIARYHHKQIRLEDRKLAALRISGAFPADRLDSMLNAVARILPVHVVHLNNDLVLIKPAGKPQS